MINKFLKSLFSHFIDIRIEQVKTKLNGNLQVSMRNGRYILQTENAIYSYDDLYSNFADTFIHLKIENYPIEEVLILGLGLGSIPLILEKKHGLKANYTAIEIDEIVIYLAQKYSLHRLKSSVKCIHSDAFEWVKQARSKYDLILIDIFIDDQIPSAFDNIEFLASIKKILNPAGQVVFNRIYLTGKNKMDTDEYYQTVFSTVFSDTFTIDTHANKMLIAK